MKRMVSTSVAEAVEQAAQLGVDAVGFVLYPPSVRAVDLETLSVLQSIVPPFMVALKMSSS